MVSKLGRLGHRPTGFWCYLARKLTNYKWLAKMRILSNSAKFSDGRPLLPAYNFSATMASISSTYRLGLSKLFDAWKYASNHGTVSYCRLDNVRLAAVAAILPDSCHPSSLSQLCSIKWRHLVKDNDCLFLNKNKNGFSLLPDLGLNVIETRIHKHPCFI